MGDTKISDESHGFRHSSVALCVLVAIYVFIPSVFGIPIDAMSRRGLIPEHASDYFFAPLSPLFENSPRYKKLLVAEATFFDKLFKP